MAAKKKAVLATESYHVQAALEAAGAKLVRKLGGVWHDNGGMCRCPAHDDRIPSLSVRIGDRSLLFKCFAGCTGLEVMLAIRHFNFDVPVDDNAVARPATHFDLRKRERIRSIWRDARIAAGSPVATYLEILSASPMRALGSSRSTPQSIARSRK